MNVKGYWKFLVESILVILIGVVIGVIVFWLSGYSVSFVYYWFIVGFFGFFDGIVEILVKFVLIMFMVIMFVLGVRMGFF